MEDAEFIEAVAKHPKLFTSFSDTTVNHLMFYKLGLDEVYYQEYKDILIKVIDNKHLPIVYNVNFGHATPRCALQYGVVAKVDMKQKKIFMDK